jgi:hypothetical protein
MGIRITSFFVSQRSLVQTSPSVNVPTGNAIAAFVTGQSRHGSIKSGSFIGVQLQYYGLDHFLICKARNRLPQLAHLWFNCCAGKGERQLLARALSLNLRERSVYSVAQGADMA